MDELIERMKVILATSFSLALKAQNYHWNVTGIGFAQHHEFFGDYYTQIQESSDQYAEQIRVLGSFAPGSLKRFSELTLISDEISIPSTKFMFVRLAADNKLFLMHLNEARNVADGVGAVGLVSLLESKIEYHDKIQWMLESHTTD